jgi:predicted methyltransferase
LKLKVHNYISTIDPIYIFPKRIRKLNTIAIKPETSQREKPMNAHLINWSKITETGFLQILKTKFAKIIPTPIATPAREINGILEAKYLKPNKINQIYNML